MVTRNDPNIPHPEQIGDGEFIDQIDERWLELIDIALKVQRPLAGSYVARLRDRHPEATTHQLMHGLTSRFTHLMTATGAGVGGVAALPGLGTAAAIGLTVGEGVSFGEACAFVTLAAAEIHGVDMSDPGTRRLVLTAILSGDRGTEIMARALGKQGLQWNAVLGGGGGFLPNVITKQITRYVRRRVISRTGRLWFLRLLPFGIGAIIGGVGARAVARSVSEALHEIFSQAPSLEGELVGDLPALDG
ncbi:MAG TPA: hypothetical protein H9786_15100 [Candidatus Brachybacterium merdavium]|uniref:EcsC family protein n=1 Tax=Candidatus Brachybacterium merdavium TaxID=2838513 RepID=A0A9D2RQ11_9MICO|nr:hypothetical protein [Candidatus Brachybacterium merdavium]